MTPRADFQTILLRQRRRMDAERRQFAVAAVGAIKATQRGDGRVFDTLAYALAMREIDVLMGEFYGQWPGDRRARFWRLILNECRAARGLAFQRAIQGVRRRLKAHPDLMRKIRAEAA